MKDDALIRGLVLTAIMMNDSDYLTTDLPENSTTEMYDDYEYNFDESVNTFFWDELAPTLIVYSITLLIGIAGNILIIFTITVYRRMKSTTNMFLASLASADLLLILICIPVKVAKLFSYTWTMGEFLCKMVHYMQGVSAICSVLTLTAMSIERYYAIVHPMKAKYVCTISQAKKIIIATWGASFLLAVPILFVQVHMLVGEKYLGYWCVRDWNRSGVWRAHELYMFLLILVFPTTVMAITYSAICWEICRVIQRRSYMTSGKATLNCESYPLSSKRTGFKPKMRLEEDSQTVRQVIKMLVAVVVVFVVCWGPMLTDNLLMAFDVLEHERTNSLKHMGTAFHLMAYFNSCVNPIVYGFMSKNFRDSFSKALCCRGRAPRRQLSVSHTRTTSLRTQDTRAYIN
ncbi:QRFP-like peptide receptor isoform X2 [Halyomorpha halys]|uniref:QRFP-like peptide receptor isoform X2 n=1 Tax=Halyomorpha halys TaxID=286706 RepID=UPI0006D4D63C|nr:QRFP-like peptide receptor isoform X2 [Halyomorpha halys]